MFEYVYFGQGGLFHIPWNHFQSKVETDGRLFRAKSSVEPVICDGLILEMLDGLLS